MLALRRLSPPVLFRMPDECNRSRGTYLRSVPNGHTWSFEAGKSATYDRETKPGGRSLFGVREGNKLKPHIHCRPTATSTEFNPANYDLSNDRPLKAGFGVRAYSIGYARDGRV